MLICGLHKKPDEQPPLTAEAPLRKKRSHANMLSRVSKSSPLRVVRSSRCNSHSYWYHGGPVRRRYGIVGFFPNWTQGATNISFITHAKSQRPVTDADNLISLTSWWLHKSLDRQLNIRLEFLTCAHIIATVVLAPRIPGAHMSIPHS